MVENRVYNFSAGPSMLPEEVLKRAQSEMLSFRDAGMSVMEMSHRSAAFKDIFDAAQYKLRQALKVPESHEILFLQGGGTQQFASVPMNLIENGSADYAVTGLFSGNAAEEAKKYGEVNIAYSGAENAFTHIPTQAELKHSSGAKYFYYCANNTAYGTEWGYIPQTDAPLACDMSSNILSKPVDVSRYGLIFAGAQKNMAPAGLTVVIIDRSLAGRELECTPKIMNYGVQIKAGSMLNTPPCFCIYILSLVLDWVGSMGGAQGMAELRRERAGLVYDCLDNSALFKPIAERGCRSEMNVTFRTGKDELDAQFVKGAAERGLVNLKGHKKAGGLRASLYNAMPVEGARALVDYIKKFEVEHHV